MARRSSRTGNPLEEIGEIPRLLVPVLVREPVDLRAIDVPEVPGVVPGEAIGAMDQGLEAGTLSSVLVARASPDSGFADRFGLPPGNVANLDFSSLQLCGPATVHQVTRAGHSWQSRWWYRGRDAGAITAS